MCAHPNQGTSWRTVMVYLTVISLGWMPTESAHRVNGKMLTAGQVQLLCLQRSKKENTWSMHLKTRTQKGHALYDFSSSLDNFSSVQNSSISVPSQDRGRENRASSERRVEYRKSEHLLAFFIPTGPWLVWTSFNYQVLLTCGMSQD